MDITRKTKNSDTHEHRILVFGIGGSGVNVLQYMPEQWTERFKGCAVDTDHQTIATCNRVETVHLETRTTQGMSTGGDVDSGRRAVVENRERLAALCASADVVFIVAGFGGGTGTGGATALAEIASDTGALVLGFVMLPFEFEGQQRMQVATQGLAAFQELADGVVVIENQRLLTENVAQDDIKTAFDRVSRTVADSIRAMWSLLTKPGLVNLDFSDFRRMVMDSHGLCTLVTEQSTGSKRAERVVKAVLDHGLFDTQRVLQESRAVIVGICGGEDLTLADVQTVMSALEVVIDDAARIVVGTAIVSEYQGRIGLTVLASECFKHEEEPESPVMEAGQEQSHDSKAVGAVHKGGRRRKNRPVQSQLNLDGPGKGRFKDVEPTLRNGEDLDVPTFIRRGIKLQSKQT